MLDIERSWSEFYQTYMVTSDSRIRASSSPVGVSFSGPGGSIMMTHSEFQALATEMLTHGMNKGFYKETSDGS